MVDCARYATIALNATFSYNKTMQETGSIFDVARALHIPHKKDDSPDGYTSPARAKRINYLTSTAKMRLHKALAASAIKLNLTPSYAVVPTVRIGNE